MTACDSAPVVTFVYSEWVAQYPMFAGVTSPAASGFFDRATILCSNRLGPVKTACELKILLYLLTSHLAWLGSPRNAAGLPDSAGTQFNNLVGRVSGATEGSVSVQTDNQYAPGTAQYYQQTTWGSEYWEMTKKYRTMRYRAGVRPVLGVSQTPWLYPNDGG